ncbi:MAG: hypothetical protein V4594_25200 [Bacteroidota bacterium]
MNYELNNLKSFITTYLSADGTRSVINAASIKELEFDLVKEEERIKRALQDAVFSGKPDPIIESFIQNHQSALVNMANDIQSLLPPHQLAKLFTLSARPSVYNLYKQVYFTICRLLDYIEKYFYRYFNLDHQIPDGYAILFNQEFKRDKQFILSGLKRYRIDGRLQGIIRDFLNSFAEQVSRERTYRDALYIKNFISEIKLLIAKDCKFNCTKKMCIALSYLNFNNPAFIYYAQRFVTDHLNGIRDAVTRYKVLNGFLDYFMAFQVKPDVYYNRNWPTVKVVMKSWLAEKVEAMKERPNFKISVPNVRHKKNAASKIHSSLSVGQWGCYVQVQEQEKIFVKNKKKDLIRITAGTYSSVEMETMSEKSLSNACYDVSQSDAAIVMDACFRMGNRIKKDFFRG